MINARFLALTVCGVFLCASGAYAAGNVSAKTTTLNKALLHANASAAKQHTGSAHQILAQRKDLLAQVYIRAILPGRIWNVSCAAVLSGGKTILLDNPCTEILAVAYTSSSQVEMKVNLSNLGQYTQGKMAGEPFSYQGAPYPGNFQVREDGYAVFTLPARSPELLDALNKTNAPALSSLELSKLFLLVDRPQSQVEAPQEGSSVAYNPKEVAPFKTFLKQLNADISNYVKHLSVTADMTDCNDDPERSFPAKGFIASSNGLVILRARQANSNADLYDEIKTAKDADAKNLEYCVYVNMKNLGSYPNGKPFFANNTHISQSQIYLAPADSISFTMQLPNGKPVASALNGKAFQDAFGKRKIQALWLQNYAPRVERAFEAVDQAI